MTVERSIFSFSTVKESSVVPLFLDIHRNSIVPTFEEVKQGHMCDLEAQDKHGVTYLKYWFSQNNGTLCCLVDAPNKEAARAVHLDAHGNLADDIIEVESNLVESFLGGERLDQIGTVCTKEGEPEPPFRTILFTDLVGSTSYTQERGDEEAMKLLRKHDEIVRGALSTFGGREIKHTGDGIMASFVSVLASIQSAIAIQTGINFWNKENPTHKFSVRIGLSAGEPVEENKDLFGAAVQMAARICNEAGADEIFVSNVVYELCIGKNLSFTSLGEKQLKGFPNPSHIYAVAWP